jgi:Rod binding domain-containing protein
MADITMPDQSASFFRASQARMDAVTSNLRPEAGSKLDAKTLRKIDEAAQEFEAVFLSEMLKPMFEGIEVNEMFGGGKGEEMFSDLLVSEYGKNMAANGGIGIASSVREELIRQQEGAIK